MGPLFSVGLFIIAFSLYDSLDLGKHVNPGGTEGFSGAGKADPSASTSQDASSRSERPLEVSQEELWREVDRMRSERNVVGDSGWTSEWVTSRENRLGDLINELRVRERMHRLAPYRLQAVVDYLESKYSVEALDEIIRDVKEKGVGSSFYNESKIDRDLPKEGALKASVGDKRFFLDQNSGMEGTTRKIYSFSNRPAKTDVQKDPSPWPISGSLGALATTVGGVMYMHSFQGGATLLSLGLIFILYTMFVWWRDVLRESTLEGHHTKVVQLGPRYGFIVSEVMFLFALFRASSHSSLAPTARRAILVRKEKRANSVIQDILILELMLSSGEEVFIERGKSRVASRLTDFSKSEEYLSFDHPEHEGAALDVRSTVKERRKGPCSFSPCSDDALLARGATYLLREGRKPMELDFGKAYGRSASSTLGIVFSIDIRGPFNSEVGSQYTDTPVIDRDLSLVTGEHSKGKPALAFSTPTGISLGGRSELLTLSLDHKPLGGCEPKERLDGMKLDQRERKHDQSDLVSEAGREGIEAHGAKIKAASAFRSALWLLAIKSEVTFGRGETSTWDNLSLGYDLNSTFKKEPDQANQEIGSDEGERELLLKEGESLLLVAIKW
ncbi:cytochrome c oxidase subunit 3 [Tanacetum coccineum]